MRSYCATDQRIHLLSQIIAKVNRSFVPAKPDDSHTNLYYEPISRRLYGRWFEATGRSYVLTLDLTNLKYELVNKQYGSELSIGITGKTLIQLESELARAFENFGIDTKEVFRPLHFEIEQYDFVNNAFEMIRQKDLEEWCFYRTQANHMCSDFLGFTQQLDEVRIWPHHFDTGVFVQANEKLGVGFGLAMNDQVVDQPYYYMSAYPKEGAMDYGSIPQSQYWRMEYKEGWAGCILSLDDIENKEEQERRTILLDYLGIYKWMLNQ